jgi:hypothetical protein
MEILRTDPVVTALYDHRHALILQLNACNTTRGHDELLTELTLVQERIVHRTVGYGHSSA